MFLSVFSSVVVVQCLVVVVCLVYISFHWLLRAVCVVQWFLVRKKGRIQNTENRKLNKKKKTIRIYGNKIKNKTKQQFIKHYNTILEWTHHLINNHLEAIGQYKQTPSANRNLHYNKNNKTLDMGYSQQLRSIITVVVHKWWWHNNRKRFCQHTTSTSIASQLYFIEGRI